MSRRNAQKAAREKWTARFERWQKRHGLPKKKNVEKIPERASIERSPEPKNVERSGERMNVDKMPERERSTGKKKKPSTDIMSKFRRLPGSGWAGKGQR
jgi:hypothetical protein